MKNKKEAKAGRKGVRWRVKLEEYKTKCKTNSSIYRIRADIRPDI